MREDVRLCDGPDQLGTVVVLARDRALSAPDLGFRVDVSALDLVMLDRLEEGVLGDVLGHCLGGKSERGRQRRLREESRGRGSGERDGRVDQGGRGRIGRRRRRGERDERRVLRLESRGERRGRHVRLDVFANRTGLTHADLEREKDKSEDGKADENCLLAANKT